MGAKSAEKKVPDLGPSERELLPQEYSEVGKLELVSSEENLGRLDSVMGLFSAAATNRALLKHGWGPEREIALLIDVAEDSKKSSVSRIRAVAHIREICRENLERGSHFYGAGSRNGQGELDGAGQKTLADNLSKDAELLDSLGIEEETDRAKEESQGTQTEEDYEEKVGGFTRTPEDARAFDESRVQPEPLDDSYL